MPAGYTPIFRIMHEGTDITDRFNDRTTMIKVDLSAGGSSDICNITLDDRDWKIASPEVGAWLEIYLGYKEVGLAQMGQFEISTVTYSLMPKQITLTGNGIGFKSNLKAPTIKSHDNKTLKEIIEEIGKAGGRGVVVDNELGQLKVPFVNQITSPLHLLHQLERTFGGIAKFEEGKIIFGKRDANKAFDGKELPTIVLRPQHVFQLSVRHDERGDYSGAKAAWYDENKELKWEEAKPNAPVHNSEGGSTTEPYRIGKPFNSQAEAKAAAQAQVEALRRSTGEANITLAKGDPWIRDTSRLVLEQFRPGIEGFYVIDTASHSYVKEAGLQTTLLCKPGVQPTGWGRQGAVEYFSPLSPKMSDTGNLIPAPGQPNIPPSTRPGGPV